MLPGQVSTGGWLSITATVKEQALVLPLASVAVQVTVVTPLANVAPLLGTQLTEPPGQLSVNEAVKLTTREHTPAAVFVVIFPGQTATGGSASLTVTENVQALVLPLESVVVHVTVVTPLLNVLPLAGLQAPDPPEQLSMNVAVKFTTRVQAPEAVLVTIFAGHIVPGSWLSLTVTVNVQVFVLPLVSEAVQVTAVTPLAKVAPLVGTQLTVAPPQLSLAVGTL